MKVMLMTMIFNEDDDDCVVDLKDLGKEGDAAIVLVGPVEDARKWAGTLFKRVSVPAPEAGQ